MTIGAKMNEQELTIHGMTCDHCVMAVRRELEKIAGLEVKEVRIGSALIAFEGSRVPSDRIRQAVEDAGYSLV